VRPLEPRTTSFGVQDRLSGRQLRVLQAFHGESHRVLGEQYGILTDRRQTDRHEVGEVAVVVADD
jgi:hypothetical protein